MTRATRIALGEAGFERAAVWSAVGFALSYVAFEAIAFAVPGAGPATGAAATIGVLGLATVVGVTAFAAVGGGALPAILLAYGPVAAVLLRTAGPEPYAIPFADPAPFLLAVAEPLALALPGAVGVGLAGFVVGRVALGLLSDGDATGESDSEPSSSSASDAAAGDD